MDLFLKRQCSRNLVVECVEEAVDNITLCTVVCTVVHSCVYTVCCVQCCTVRVMLSTAASLNLSGAHRPWSARTAGRGPRSGASDIITRTAHSEALIVSGTGCGVDAPGPRRRTRASRRPEGAAPIGARGSTCRPLCTPDLRADAAARFLERRAGVDRNA